MSALRATFGFSALLFVSAAPAGAVAHPRLSPVSYSEHQVVTQAAEQIRLDRPAGSKNGGGKKCPRACADRNQNAPTE